MNAARLPALGAVLTEAQIAQLKRQSIAAIRRRRRNMRYDPDIRRRGRLQFIGRRQLAVLTRFDTHHIAAGM